MNLIKHPTAIALLLLTALATTALAQQKRQTPAKPQPKAAVTPAPPPTFDTLVPADHYTIYGEVRGVGQVIRSSAFNDFLEPILKLAGPPKEFRTIVKWLNAHADELMTSRLLVATWPNAKDVPDTIIAIEFASSEEAAKFAGPLNEFLPLVLPEPELSADGKKKQTAHVKPNYHSQQAGSLLLLTPAPLTLKKLKPAGSKPMTEDVNFRAARNRFNSEPLFVFIDVKMMERQQEEQMKQYQELERKAEQERKKRAEEQKKVEGEVGDEFKLEERTNEVILAQPPATPQGTLTATTPDPVSMAVLSITSSFLTVESDWPDGVSLALTFENDSFDLRVLLVNEPGEKSDVVPFMPLLLLGPAYIPESPNIVPADTELLVTMSLDLPQIYAALSKPRPTATFYSSRGNLQTGDEVAPESPFASIEKKLGMNLKDVLLPLLGTEIALRLPATGLDLVGLPRGPFATAPETRQDSASGKAPVLFISVRDKEGVRTLMPKLIDALGYKGASSLAQTERREDTEIVSFVNLFSYAFIENFLVLSADPAAIRYVVDSYLKHETLAGEANFRSYTRWQPRPAQGQVYISAALMESYKTWAESPTTHVSDQTRAFLTRLSAVPQPISYSLSNEGLGPFHELHVPKNLVLMAVAGISGEVNPPPTLSNERRAIGTLYLIANAEALHKHKGAGSYATLEQLIAEQSISKESLENSGYRFDVTVSGDKFELSAVPVEYGKSGTRSFFLDQTMILRGADRNGAPASSSDPRITN